MSYGMQCKLVCMIPDLPITTIIAMLICNSLADFFPDLSFKYNACTCKSSFTILNSVACNLHLAVYLFSVGVVLFGNMGWTLPYSCWYHCRIWDKQILTHLVCHMVYIIYIMLLGWSTDFIALEMAFKWNGITTNSIWWIFLSTMQIL